MHERVKVNIPRHICIGNQVTGLCIMEKIGPRWVNTNLLMTPYIKYFQYTIFVIFKSTFRKAFEKTDISLERVDFRSVTRTASQSKLDYAHFKTSEIYLVTSISTRTN